MDEINKEIEEMAETMEKSMKTPNEQLMDTIQNLGPEGLKKALPTLSDEEKVMLKEVMSEMKKAKSPSMDENYHVGYVKGNIKDTVIQEDKVDDDADEKLVDPKKAKMNNQGDNSPEGFEGQVIKSEDCKKDAKEEAEKEVDKHEDKMHKDKKKMDMKKSELLEIKAQAEEVLKSEGVEVTDELVKSKMKELIKAKMLKEEDQVGDTDKAVEGTPRAKKENVKDLQEGENNKAAQDKVNDMNQGGLKKAIFAGENDLLKARTGGRNHHFSVNGYYDEVLAKSETPEENLEKSEKPVTDYDLNDLIEKDMTTTWKDLENDSNLKKSKEAQNGSLIKSFADNEIAQALGLTEEEAKQILGE